MSLIEKAKKFIGKFYTKEGVGFPPHNVWLEKVDMTPSYVRNSCDNVYVKILGETGTKTYDVRTFDFNPNSKSRKLSCSFSTSPISKYKITEETYRILDDVRIVERLDNMVNRVDEKNASDSERYIMRQAEKSERIRKEIRSSLLKISVFVVPMLLSGCGSNYKDDGFLYDYDQMQTAWLQGAMCERCYHYKHEGYPNDNSKKICEKYSDCNDLKSFDKWFMEYQQKMHRGIK